MKYSREEWISLATPTLDEMHDALDQKDAWDMPFHEFYRTLSEREKDSVTLLHVNYDFQEFKQRWELVQYMRKRYGTK